MEDNLLQTEDEKLQEYPLIHDILEKIPKKLTYTFTTKAVELTCFDATSAHFVFGTNAGCAFLYNRESGNLIKVVHQDKSDHVSCVRLLDGLECQLAMGCENGHLTIVLFSKTSAGSKQIQKFNLGRNHKTSICCLEWSVNGMKLFSGDLHGEIFCTSVDVENNTCTIAMVLKESTEIIQMEYTNKLLLISTLERSFVFDNGEKKALGSKPNRKGRHGACFSSNTTQDNELKVYSSRPGMRIWISDCNGLVTSTLKLKESAENATCIIQLKDYTEGIVKDFTFGTVKRFHTNCLVSHHGASLYVISLVENGITAEIHNLSDVLQVQTCHDEIFIFRRSGKLHRIAFAPDLCTIGSCTDCMQLNTNDNVNSQDGKSSLYEIKKSLTPLVSSIHSKMMSFNTEKLTNKLQTQAKGIQKKFSAFSAGAELTELFTSSRKGSTDRTSSQSSETVSCDTSQPVISDALKEDFAQENKLQSIVKSLLSELIGKIEAGDDLIFALELSCEGNVTDESNTVTFRSEQVSLEEAGDEIVFKSKQRKRKARSSTERSISFPDQKITSDNPAELFAGHGSSMLKDADQIGDFQSFSSASCPEGSLSVLLVESLDKPPAEEVMSHAKRKEADVVRSFTDPSEDQETRNVGNETVGNKTSSTRVSHDSPVQSDDEMLQKLSLSSFKLDSEQEVPELLSSDDRLNDILSKSNHNYDIDMQLAGTDMQEKDASDPAHGIYSLDSCVADESAGFIEDIYENNENDFSEDNSSAESVADEKELQENYTDKNISDEKYFTVVRMSPELYGSSCVSSRSADVWTVNDVPSSSISSLAGSEGIICYVGARNQIYCVDDNSAKSGAWNKISKRATHLAVSPSGDFIWIVTRRGKIYAASVPVIPVYDRAHTTVINLEWQLVAMSGTYICLGAHESWFVDEDGRLLRQQALSPSQPYLPSSEHVKVEYIKNGATKSITNVSISHISLTSDVAWLLTTDGCLLCNSLSALEDGKLWKQVSFPTLRNVDGEEERVKVIASDYQTTMFIVDGSNRLWFRSEVTRNNPAGRRWWQVYLNEYVNQVHTKQFPSALPTISCKSSSSSCGYVRVSDVAVSFRAVWVASSDHRLHVSTGPITGNRWELISIPGLASLTKWNQIATSSAFCTETGSWESFVWLTQLKGEVVCCRPQASGFKVTAISPPVLDLTSVLSLSVSREALWMLYDNGQIYVRCGISPTSTTGVEWRPVVISHQLGDAKLVSLDCGMNCVWAVDENGYVYVRMGVNVTQSHDTMAPAWLSLDSCPISGSTFGQVACSPSDINVWALDCEGNPYVRTGVTTELPVGEGWKRIEGPQLKQLAISNHSVWGLCKDGNIVQRCGITLNDCMGDYWKRMPGHFCKLAVTPYDQLWVIDEDERLRHHTTHLYYTPLLEAIRDDSPLVNFEDREDSKLDSPDRDICDTWEIL